MRATYPVCYRVSDDEWCCEMRDRKTGRTWGVGYSTNRQHAITLARQEQPREMFIKRSIGWVKRHPILATVAVSGYMMFRRPIKQIANVITRTIGQAMYAIGFPRKACTAVSRASELLP